MRAKYWNKIKSYCGEYGLLTIIVFAGICLVYQVWAYNLINTPLSYSQDGIGTLVGEKILIEEGGLGTKCARLGAPYGQNTSDFSTATLLPVLLLKVGALFTDNWIWGLNLSYFIGFFITAWISYYVLKKLGISRIFSMVLSVLFTFLPYHMLRGTEHFSLAIYALVPISIYYIILFMQYDETKIKDIPWKRKVIFFCWMILIGLNGIYYSFFTCFLFCAAILYNVIQRYGLQSIKKCFLGICSIVAGIVIASLPNIIYIFNNGNNTETVNRLRSEIATYALRISQLLLPITEHRIPLFAKIKDIYNNSFTVNENDSASLGIIFACGFIILCVYLIKEKRLQNDILGKLAAINICMVLYASVGGIVEIQAIVFKLIRCSNRISVFIAFVCCIAVGTVLDRAIRKNITDKGKWKKLLIAMVVLAIGMFDQTKAKYVDDKILVKMENEKQFIRSIEDFEAEGTMIFQLPNVVYPEQGMKERMGDYSHFIGYLYSDTLKWSYGAMKGREGSKLLNEISEKDTKAMIKAMKETGFGGIYIDRWGYKEEEAAQLEAELQHELKRYPLEDKEGRYAYYSFAVKR